MLARAKYDRGRSLGHLWIFAGIVRVNPMEYFMEIVKNRNRSTLLYVIKKRIKPGTIISSDSWRAYSDIQNLLPEYDF